MTSAKDNNLELQLQQIENILDLLKQQLQGLPDIATPAALQATLLPHQVQGLAWMVQRENGGDNDDKHPFYQAMAENGRTVYLCRLTQSSQPTAPPAVQGGILADGTYVGITNTTWAAVAARWGGNML